MNKVLNLKKLLAASILIAYVFLSLFGVLQTSHTSHMGHVTHSCPYMVGEQGLCTMNLFDHIASWQQFSSAVFPLMNILLALSLVVFSSFWLYLSSSPPLIYLRLHRRKFTEPLYQALFSNGILNSKAF